MNVSGASVIGHANRRGVPKSAVIPSVDAPLVFGFDAVTPEQISIRAPLVRTMVAGSTVDAEYRLQGSVTWLSAGRLFQVFSSTLPVGAPAGIVNSFAGCIFDLLPGNTYDVRLTITEPGQAVIQVTSSQTTRALPAAAPTANKTATPATLAAQLLTLVPGDCLQLSAGTYSAFTLANSGTVGSPIYVRGVSRLGTIISNSSRCVTWNASHVVLENMTLLGSQSDSGTAASSEGIIFSTGFLATPQTNATIRNITATGFDRFCKAYEPVNGRLVYDCTISGNNTWDKTYTVNPASGQPNYTWNDDGVSGPGQGNCFFDSTINGHGDSTKIESSAGIFYSAAIFVYRIKCGRTGDDFAETDDGSGNIGIYDNEIKNAGQNISVDNINGGPVYFFRNRCANTARGPIKPTSDSQNVAIYNNTFIRTTSATTFGFYAASSGANTNWRVKNNLIVYRGASDVIRWDCSLAGLDWDYNAIYPATGANISLGAGRGTQASLAAAKTALAPLMAHDVAATTNPFAATITLAADYTTEYTGSMTLTLAGGVTSLNAGVALPNITDSFTGAAPDIGAVITGRTVATVGDPTAWPFTTPAANTIGTISTNTLNSLTADANEQFSFSKVLGTWGGASVVLQKTSGIVTDFLYVIFGGGHGDTGNDAVYAFRASTAAFETMLSATAPVVAAGYTAIAISDTTNGENTVSGRPSSQHVYNNLQPLHSDDAQGPAMMQVRGAGVGSSANTSGRAHRFDTTAKTWARYGSLNTGGLGNTQAAIIKDTLRHQFAHFPSSAGTDFYTLDYSLSNPTWTAGTQSARGGNWSDTFGAMGVYDPIRDLYIAGTQRGVGSNLRAIAGGSLTGSWTELTFTGSGPTFYTLAPSYRSANDTFVVIDTSSTPPTGVYVLTPPASSPLSSAWTWSRISFTGASHFTNNSTAPEWGARFQYLEALDALVVCPAAGFAMEMWKF